MTAATTVEAAPTVIDIEASGFGRGSYPIEIGFVLPDGRGDCMLIRPIAAWRHWDPAAEALHHISRDLLRRHGQPVGDVVERLERQLHGRTVYSDGWGERLHLAVDALRRGWPHARLPPRQPPEDAESRRARRLGGGEGLRGRRGRGRPAPRERRCPLVANHRHAIARDRANLTAPQPGTVAKRSDASCSCAVTSRCRT